MKIISWQGLVYEKFTGNEVKDIRENNPDSIAHPECPPDVISASDFAGSIKYGTICKRKKPKKVLLVTECSMSDNIFRLKIRCRIR